MEKLFDLKFMELELHDLQTWLFEQVFVVDTLGQLAVVLAAFLAALLIAPAFRRGADNLVHRWKFERSLERVTRMAATLSLPIIWLFLQWVSYIAATGAGWPSQFIRITVSLLTAWVLIRLLSQLVRDPTWSKIIAFAAWTLAALNILGLLGETIELLDSFAFTLGELRISVLTVIKGVLSLAILLWVATVLSRLMERRISTLPNLTPSVQVLFSKLLKITLITLAILAAVSSVGIDLTVFAVFGGAVGVGVGFGLQKVVSNLVSGVILLMDKSVKPGDVISVGDTYGRINTLGARYASVVTRDGMEYLIPNEEIITQQVINWSYSDNAVRLRCPIGISYSSDVRKAIALCLESAGQVGRVLDTPNPVCLLRGFGDSSVDLELRFWINDPQNGTANVRSEVLLLVWDKFHEHGIEIPFPQRDLHIRSADGLPVKLAAE